MAEAFNFEHFQHLIRAHATLMPIGFLILLPLGVLIPRYARTFTNKWFYGHVGFQLFLAGPIIIAGFGVGVHATNSQVQAGFIPKNFGDQHTQTGLALFILYVVQVVLGLTSHLFKRPSHRFFLYRAPHHILHIAVGLAIIGLAFFQVHLGYTFEWPAFVGLPVPASVNKAWMAWVIIIPILYVLGLAFVPRQISQESAMRRTRNSHTSEQTLRKEEAYAT